MSFRVKDHYQNRNQRPPIRHRGGDIVGDLYIDGNLTLNKDLKAKNFYATGNYHLHGHILLPPGSIIQSASINEPAGWLDCDGRVLSRLEYPDLFNAIGYTFSYGIFGYANHEEDEDDVSFNLPDFRGRVGLGIGSGDGLTQRNLADMSGSETHTLTISEIPSHNHSGTTDISGEHSHTINGLVKITSNNTPSGLDNSNDEIDNKNLSGSTISSNAGSHNHTFTTNYTGGGQSHNIMQPFLAVRYLIKY